jgi:hypothetical protein
MKSQIIWLVLQCTILTLVWSGTRIQIKKGQSTVFQAAGVILGTITYCLMNDVILYCGGFFDVIITKIF